MSHLHLVGAPPVEDSEDFSDEEAQEAIETTSIESFAKLLEEGIRPLYRPNVAAAIKKHSLRRKNNHLYCRTSILIDGEPDKNLTFRVDWLNNG